jgi:hypothetical protein
MGSRPSANEAREWLRRSGWSAVEESQTAAGGTPRHRVVVSDGARSVSGEGDSAEEAWWQACGRVLGVPRSGG